MLLGTMNKKHQTFLLGGTEVVKATRVKIVDYKNSDPLVLDLAEYHTRFFFFQAEDGIRDLYVTGDRTCALPIMCGVSRATVSSQRTPPSGRPKRWRRSAG